MKTANLQAGTQNLQAETAGNMISLNINNPKNDFDIYVTRDKITANGWILSDLIEFAKEHSDLYLAKFKGL